ncbi:MAG: hypothetical protein IT548_12005 [Alphaproteobacteria bacterium]|nr:hypothetical protein [Alphaproteobacteria bacterium]
MRVFAFLFILIAALGSSTVPARAEEERRTVLLIADAGADTAALATPPLTQLGMLVETHDAGGSLPELGGRDDVRGIVVWLTTGQVGDPFFADWVRDAVRRDVPVVMMGALPEVEDRFGLFLSLGLLYSYDDRAYSYDMRVVDWDEALIGFERRFDRLFPDAPVMRPLDAAQARSLLVLERRGNAADRTHPVIVTRKGAYAAESYAVWTPPGGGAHRWMIDPVAWFRAALRIGTMPVPDITTLNGRRIFAPAIAPARPADAEAAASAAFALGRTHAMPLPVRTAPGTVQVPPAAQDCHDRLRARLLGYGGPLGALDETEAARRTDAFAPSLLTCAAERDLLVPAAAAVFDAAAPLPLTDRRGDLDAIEAGFRTVRIDRLAGFAWRIRERGALQTLRFDDTGMHVDWKASQGVLGAARAFDGLYIALDPDDPEAVVALTQAPWAPPPFPVLVESRWSVFGLMRTGERASMTVEAEGGGAMAWQTEPGSHWEIRLAPKAGGLLRYRITADGDGVIAFGLPEVSGGRALLELIRYYGGGS